MDSVVVWLSLGEAQPMSLMGRVLRMLEVGADCQQRAVVLSCSLVEMWLVVPLWRGSYYFGC
jgi:hypothetical protein